MYQFPIGVMLDSFRLPFDEALNAAVRVGAKGLQMYATSGEFSPEQFTKQNRSELLKKVKDHGLVFSALCGDLGQGFWQTEKNPTLIERSKRILDLAGELETNIVTTHVGVIPSNPNEEQYKVMQEACFTLSRYADQAGAHFAIETGPEPAAVLKTFLDGLGSSGVAVNLDPANFVMVTGDDPVEAVYTLKDYIVHTHAKDGIKLMDKDPRIIYGMIENELKIGTSFREVPLGQGTVDFNRYLAALDEIGYRGFLTIEREVGENPFEDIQLAADFLRDKMQG